MTFPMTRKYGVTAQPVTTVGNDLRTIVGRAEESETVTRVEYVPVSTQAGANSNSRTLTLYNRNATDGTGTTVVAQLALTTGVDLTDNVPKVIPISGTPANLALTSAQVLEWSSDHIGTGIPDPGGRVVVTTVRTIP